MSGERRPSLLARIVIWAFIIFVLVLVMMHGGVS